MPTGNQHNHTNVTSENFLASKLLSELFPNADHWIQVCKDPWRQLRKKYIKQTQNEIDNLEELLVIEKKGKETCCKHSDNVDWDALISLVEKQIKTMDVFVEAIKEVEQYYRKQPKNEEHYTAIFDQLQSELIKKYVAKIGVHEKLLSALEMVNSAKQNPSEANVGKIFIILDEYLVKCMIMLDDFNHAELDPYFIKLFTKNPDSTDVKSENLSNTASASGTPIPNRDIPEEERLISKIKAYSTLLSKKGCSSAQAKSESLLKIVNLYEGMDKNALSIAQVSDIRSMINDEKEILSQHRHWPVFNCFFQFFKPETLENRVTSNRLITDLDNYLAILEEGVKNNLTL